MKWNAETGRLGPAVILLAAACGSRVEAGLANAPGIERTNRPQRRGDVIANGKESCGATPRSEPPIPVDVIAPCNEEHRDGGARRAPE